MMSSDIDKIIEEFMDNRANIEIPLDQIKQELESYDSVVLYGAGSAGIAFLHYLLDIGIKPVCFCDGDIDKQGSTIEGLCVISPQEIISKAGTNCLVIVTINTDGEHYCKDFKEELKKGGHKRVHKLLNRVGCKNVIDYTFFRRCYALFKNEKYNLPACSDVGMIIENVDKIKKAYDFLTDDETRDTFKKILRFRLISDKVDIPIYSEDLMYFEYDLFPKLEGEIFVDCGACRGSSLDIFLEVSNGVFSEYYGIEPDLNNYEKLTCHISSFSSDLKEKLHIYNVAAWNNNLQEQFFILNGPGSFQADIGPNAVKCLTIDSILDGNPATYIKMNIEGSEIPALCGAKNTICKYKPRLAIMGYHKTSDFWEVPLLMRQYRADYKIALRSYMKNVSFTYYAF